ncbi:MAG: hypothetical protein A3F13_00195 [Gammaproteobacteria bacterium RIFCSPHIGHO2_12_FULL_40_19]|nr:MAG: hypothetical protein A3F13_00195 [Gammaproteobacteria bacterium RIFCSPHIGHO2_12_FULL_40_19]
MHQCKRSQRQNRNGGALISAIFITAIAAIIATALVVEQRLLIHEGSLVIRGDQGYLNLQGMQYEAELAIEKYAIALDNHKSPNGTFVPLESKLPTIEMNKMVLSGTIEDEQGKFNLNDLVYSANQPQFVALLRGLMPQIPVQKAYMIAKAITTWLTSNADDAYYLKWHPPYRAPQDQMADISELQLVMGVTPEIYLALEPYVTALPVQISVQATSTPSPQTSQPPQNPGTPAPASNAPGTPINVNSASAPVLLTVSPDLSLSKAASIVACRKQYGGFTSTATFIADCVKSQGVTTMNNITTNSTYFLSRTDARYGDHVIVLTRLWVTQIQKNNTLKVVVVWQSFE